MNKPASIRNTLVDVNDSVLIVIDMQDSFLDKYDDAKTQSITAKVAWLIQIAQYLDVPIVAMGEDIDKVGSLTGVVCEALPKNTTIYSKDYFSMADNPEIFAALEATKRMTAILVGMETDVCVAQSALGLMKKGYQVVALKDAIATTEADENTGLSRMHDAGAVISSVKALYYEWMRSVHSCVALHENTKRLNGLKPPSCLVL